MTKTLHAAALLAAVGAALGLVAVPAEVAAQSPAATTYTATLKPVPTNHVTGSGDASVQVNGNQAQVTVHTTGLVNAPHAIHIHINGQGKCPDASAAKEHNGHKAISATDGAPAYGPIMISLTTSGDTSANSAFAVDRAPSGGSINYQRTVPIDAQTTKALSSGKAVVVVHGIDFDGSGHYDNALGPSEDAPNLTQDETAPALCGVLAAASSPAPGGGGGGGGGAATTTAAPGGVVVNTPSGAGGAVTALSVVALAAACVSLGLAIATLLYTMAVLRRTDRRP